MIAQFPGECAACNGGDIFPGQDITRDGTGRWVHANIDECDGFTSEPAPEVGPSVCRVCHCTIPGFCDDGCVPEDMADQALRRAVDHAGRDPFDGFL